MKLVHARMQSRGCGRKPPIAHFGVVSMQNRGCGRVPPIADTERYPARAPSVDNSRQRKRLVYRPPSRWNDDPDKGFERVAPGKGPFDSGSAKPVRENVWQAKPNPEKPDMVWWPERSATDAQRVEVGVPFQRRSRSSRCHGEWLLVERTENGNLTSRAVAPPIVEKPTRRRRY